MPFLAQGCKRFFQGLQRCSTWGTDGVGGSVRRRGSIKRRGPQARRDQLGNRRIVCPHPAAALSISRRQRLLATGAACRRRDPCRYQSGQSAGGCNKDGAQPCELHHGDPSHRKSLRGRGAAWIRACLAVASCKGGCGGRCAGHCQLCLGNRQHAPGGLPSARPSGSNLLQDWRAWAAGYCQHLAASISKIELSRICEESSTSRLCTAAVAGARGLDAQNLSNGMRRLAKALRFDVPTISVLAGEALERVTRLGPQDFANMGQAPGVPAVLRSSLMAAVPAEAELSRLRTQHLANGGWAARTFAFQLKCPGKSFGLGFRVRATGSDDHGTGSDAPAALAPRRELLLQATCREGWRQLPMLNSQGPANISWRHTTPQPMGASLLSAAGESTAASVQALLPQELANSIRDFTSLESMGCTASLASCCHRRRGGVTLTCT
eukprot:s374_g4.t9